MYCFGNQKKKSIKAYIEQNKQKKILDWPTSSFAGKPEWTSGPNIYIYWHCVRVTD